MPSTMVHLITAYKVNPCSGALFWIGSIAPDCINERGVRDRVHFRDAPDRGEALKNLAALTNKDDSFGEGMLLHFFLDWKWDEFPLKEYIANSGRADWFLPYRNEVGLLSAWLYHHTRWSKQIWEEMISCDIAGYGRIDGVSPRSIYEKIESAHMLHIENITARPLFYEPEFVESFTSEVAKDYKAWRNNI